MEHPDHIDPDLCNFARNLRQGWMFYGRSTAIMEMIEWYTTRG
jgi:hypothetical protein